MDNNFSGYIIIIIINCNKMEKSNLFSVCIMDENNNSNFF